MPDITPIITSYRFIGMKTDTTDIVQCIRTLQQFDTKETTDHLPVAEYRVLQNIPLEEIVRTLTDAELPAEEYRTLLNYAVNTLTTPPVEAIPPRSKTEFTFLRQRTGASQQWLADKLKLSLATIRRWESNDPQLTPTSQAWEQLDKLNEWEKTTALNAVNEQIMALESYIRCCLGESYQHWLGKQAEHTLYLGLHYYRDEASYQADLDKYYPKSSTGDMFITLEDEEAHAMYIEEQMDKYSQESSPFYENTWSVFPSAGTYSIQNAITNRIVEIVENRLYDHQDAVKKTIAVSFDVHAGGILRSQSTNN